MSDQPRIAPPAELVRYLSLFHRALAAIDEYTQAGDKQGMLFGGWLANALHNVPGVLQHYSDDASQNALHMTNRLAVLPERLIKSNAPERLVSDCLCILADDNAALALGLKDDLSDIVPAPDRAMFLYLDVLYEACLAIRLTGNYFSKSNNPWDDLDDSWNKWAYDQAKLSGLIASTLRPLPSGLVKWTEFDRKALRRSVRRSTLHVPRAKQFSWIKVHQPDQPPAFKALRWLH